MEKYKFALTGFMPLLMHRIDIDAEDELKTWRRDPQNKGVSVAGDDRSPPWTWQTYLYNDGKHVVMPAENLMVALRNAGKQMILKKQKTYKELTQTGLLIDGEYCMFRDRGKQITCDWLQKIREEDFSTQAQAAKDAGFTLFGKRVRVGTSKHIRIRAKFSEWTVEGQIMAIAQEMTQPIIQQLFDLAGRQGLCDWRPGCPTPGPYGQFTAKVEKAK